MRNISQDIIEVLQFYRCLVLQLAFNGVDVDIFINKKYKSQAFNDECEYLKILLERED